jgi:arylsulfatase A-like enzyme
VILSSAVHAKQPNALFIAVDDMNDWVSVLGSDIPAITPNIDRLAARGLNFTNARTPGTYCAPARSAIFTG